mmetsp:Transcript_32449/g.58065  ORF Transcript_32449/g.58065 Transcript_32449/m.58065 type:complete len:324 (+) Transcript_32449:109-1080(+)
MSVKIIEVELAILVINKVCAVVVEIQILRICIVLIARLLRLADDSIHALQSLQVCGERRGLELLVDGEKVWREVIGVERVALDSLQSEPALGVAHQDASQQITALCGDLEVFGDLVVHVQDPLHHILQLLVLVHPTGLVLRPLKGVLTGQHRVQHHPARPNVRALAVVVSVGNDLRRDVQVGAHLGLGNRVVLVTLGVAEVADLQQGFDVVGKEGVFELDVTVHHPLVVHVVHRADELLEEPARLVLRQPVPTDHEIKQVAPRRVLHRNPDVLLRQNHLLKLYDVRMVQAAVVMDLTLHIFADLTTAINELNGDLLAGVHGPS